MLRGLAAVVFLFLGLAGFQQAQAASPQTATSPAGLWVTASQDAVIKIAPCGQDFCGSIAGIVLSPTDAVPTDWQGQTQCNLAIIQTDRSETQDNGSTAWFGSITRPRDGATFHVRLTLNGPNSLLLRGYVGLPIFGQTQTWTRYNGPTNIQGCRLTTISTLTAASQYPAPAA